MHTQRSAYVILLLLSITASTFAQEANSHPQLTALRRASSRPFNSAPLQRAVLLSSDGASRNFFGDQVAVDGDAIVVGAPSDPSDAVYVFVKPHGGWQNATETAKLKPSISGLIGFGASVAVSGDTIVVGAPDAGSDAQGMLFLYVKPAGGWTDMTETAQLSGANLGVFDQLGTSVGISGNTVVSVARNHAFVFVEPPTGWSNMTETAELSDPNATGFAVSTSISGDTIVVGANGCCIQGDSTRGQADVFIKPPGGWVTTFVPDAILKGSDETKNDSFGEVVSSSTSTIVVGSDHVEGAAYVFVEPPGGWKDMTETAELTSSDSLPGDFFSHALTTNGNLVAVGAPAWDHGTGVSGALYVYNKPGSGWQTTSQANTELLPPPAQNECELGSGVAINGATLAVGCPGAIVRNNQYQGAVLALSK